MSILRVPDAERAWTSVRLVTELWKRQPPRPLTRTGDTWVIDLGALPVDRLEYQLEVERADDSTVETICAPGAPTVSQPFGDKSVLVLDRYRAPTWLAAPAPAGTLAPLTLGTITGQLWTAPGLAAAEPAPLLVALDGPEYVRFAALDQFLAAAVAARRLPPLRAALLAPTVRDDEYSASPAFVDALALGIAELAPLTHRRFGLGASLGGLALLHAQRAQPQLFDALVLQSGSFFDPALDGQESGYPFFDRITAFVQSVVTSPTTPAPIPIALTCGTGEENIANNRAMARALASQGHPVSFTEIRDGHTWTCWRDAFEPAFGSVLAAIVPRPHA